MQLSHREHMDVALAIDGAHGQVIIAPDPSTVSAYQHAQATLNEEREAFSQPGPWIPLPIAQFRFVESTGLWTLYCANLKKRDAWRIYPEAKPTKDFEALLGQLDTDQMGVFWG